MEPSSHRLVESRGVDKQLSQLERAFVLRREGVGVRVLRFEADGSVWGFERSSVQRDSGGFTPAGRWLAWGRTVFLQLGAEIAAGAAVDSVRTGHSDSTDESVEAAREPIWAFRQRGEGLEQIDPAAVSVEGQTASLQGRLGTRGTGETQEIRAALALLEPLLPPAALRRPGAAAKLPFRFWVHDAPQLSWLQVLPSSPLAC